MKQPVSPFLQKKDENLLQEGGVIMQRIFAACLRNKGATAKELANGSKKGFGKTR